MAQIREPLLKQGTVRLHIDLGLIFGVGTLSLKKRKLNWKRSWFNFPGGPHSFELPLDEIQDCRSRGTAFTVITSTRKYRFLVEKGHWPVSISFYPGSGGDKWRAAILEAKTVLTEEQK